MLRDMKPSPCGSGAIFSLFFSYRGGLCFRNSPCWVSSSFPRSAGVATIKREWSLVLGKAGCRALLFCPPAHWALSSAWCSNGYYLWWLCPGAETSGLAKLLGMGAECGAEVSTGILATHSQNLLLGLWHWTHLSFRAISWSSLQWWPLF